MPDTIKFDRPPAGHSLSAAREGEEALIQTFEFTSMADGQYFVQRLEGFPNDILEMLSGARRILPSQIDHLLAIVKTDGTTTVYINELRVIEQVRAGKDVKAGDDVFRDDIVEIKAVELGVTVPPDEGFLYLFSRGWRMGLVYDFGPLTPDRKARTFDVAAILAQAHTYVMFQEKFALTESDWESLLRAKWFPFAGLAHSTVERSFQHVRAGWGLSELIGDVIEELRAKAPTMLESWRRHPSFGRHLEILERAVERFVAVDYMSATGLLYPRIEGILRTHHSSTGAPRRATQGNLAKAVTSGQPEGGTTSLLLPIRFEKYLSEVYFADFNPNDIEISISRNSVGHGVASPEAFNKISAAIGLLIVQQLFYTLVRPQMNSAAFS